MTRKEFNKVLKGYQNVQQVLQEDKQFTCLLVVNNGKFRAELIYNGVYPPTIITNIIHQEHSYATSEEIFGKFCKRIQQLRNNAI